MKRIVFFGDSITDANRNGHVVYSENEGLGSGYALMVAGELGYHNLSAYEFINRGNGGNNVVDLYARIKKDVWNLKPDIISILIGVNDVWSDFGGVKNGVDAKRYERIYRLIVEETKEKMPNIKMMLMEPFVLSGSNTSEYWEPLRKEIAIRGEIIRKIAMDYQCQFVELQERFDEAIAQSDAALFSADGVHPTPIGHRLIAEAWLTGFEKLL